MTKTHAHFVAEDDHGFGSVFVPTAPWREESAEILRHSGCKVLRLSSSAGFSASNLSFLPALDFLTGLEIYSWDISDISPIFELPRLQLLGLQCRFKSTADFSRLPELKVCKLFWRPKIVGLERCTNIEHLNIVSYGRSDLTELSTLKYIRRLQLTSNVMVSVAGAETMQELRVFDVFRCPRLLDISALAKCVKLEVLDIQSCRRLARLPVGLCATSLREMSLTDCGQIASLSPIESCTRLEKVGFTGDTTVADGDLDFMLQLPRLREVKFADRRHYSISREIIARRLEQTMADRGGRMH